MKEMKIKKEEMNECKMDYEEFRQHLYAYNMRVQEMSFDEYCAEFEKFELWAESVGYYFLWDLGTWFNKEDYDEMVEFLETPLEMADMSKVTIEKLPF